MKHFSLVKLAAALAICNVYIFCCTVTGSVGGSIPKETTSKVEQNSENENKLGGSVDFIGEDDHDSEHVEDNTSTIVLENLGFSKPTFVNKPVSSSYLPTSSVSQLANQGHSSSDGSSSSSTTTDNTLDIIDPYIPPQSSDNGNDPVESSSSEEISKPEPPESSEQPDVPVEPPNDPTEDRPNDPTEEKPNDPTEEKPTGSPDETPADTPYDPDAEILRVNDNGNEVSGTAVDIITKIVENEIGSTFAPEAIKAQAVTAYTYVKYANLQGKAPYCILKESTNDSVKTLVESVIGQGIYYDGELIQAVYSASSAGSTASSQNVWGGYLPYLQSVYCELDEKYDPNYGITKTFSAAEMKQRIFEFAGIALTDDPAEWFVIQSRVEGKYVGEMLIGGQEYFIDKDGDTLRATGRRFRELIMDYDIRSSAFDIEYNHDRDEFTFTTYGYGHGVGLSQNGANNLAKYWGWDYKKILTFYFQGTEVY